MVKMGGASCLRTKRGLCRGWGEVERIAICQAVEEEGRRKEGEKEGTLF